MDDRLNIEHKSLPEKLKQLMQQANVPSLRSLSERTGLSRRAVAKLRTGKAADLKYADLCQLSLILQIDLAQLIQDFIENPTESFLPKNSTEVEELRQECQYLQQKIVKQAQELRSQFQQETIQQLESLILQLPSAVYAAQTNPQMLAKNILPLLRPLDLLLKKWEIQAIGAAGEEASFDPQKHQLIESGALIAQGDRVVIRYVGYTQGEKLLYRARVQLQTKN
ncbi:MAG: nucleotide exchange factor GrpE [Oscillatoriales cyanobacterium CG2_30_44_21]|nr:MAG: nucleotide exchange factor GrpE [Oscillatoriales cyanobacterium CG2_30_44_21]